MKRDAQPLDRAKILALLMPGYQKIVLEYKAEFKAGIEKRLAGKDDEDPYAVYAEVADRLRAKAGQDQKKEGEEEENKEDMTNGGDMVKNVSMASEQAELSMDLVIFNCLEKLPWVEALAQKDSHTAKLVKGGCGTFNKHQSALLHILSKLEGRQEPHKGLL